MFGKQVKFLKLFTVTLLYYHLMPSCLVLARRPMIVPQTYLYKPGDIMFGCLYPIYYQNNIITTGNAGNNVNSSRASLCSTRINMNWIELVYSAVFAFQRMNEVALKSYNITVGYIILPTCENPGVALLQSINLRNIGRALNISFVAIIGPFMSAEVAITGPYFTFYQKTTFTPAANANYLYKNNTFVYTFAIPKYDYTNAIVSLLLYFRWTNVVILVNDIDYYYQSSVSLIKKIEGTDICLWKIIKIPAFNVDMARQIKNNFQNVLKTKNVNSTDTENGIDTFPKGSKQWKNELRKLLLLSSPIGGNKKTIVLSFLETWQFMEVLRFVKSATKKGNDLYNKSLEGSYDNLIFFQTQVMDEGLDILGSGVESLMFGTLGLIETVKTDNTFYKWLMDQNNHPGTNHHIWFRDWSSKLESIRALESSRGVRLENINKINTDINRFTLKMLWNSLARKLERRKTLCITALTNNSSHKSINNTEIRECMLDRLYLKHEAIRYASDVIRLPSYGDYWIKHTQLTLVNFVSKSISSSSEHSFTGNSIVRGNVTSPIYYFYYERVGIYDVRSNKWEINKPIRWKQSDEKGYTNHTNAPNARCSHECPPWKFRVPSKVKCCWSCASCPYDRIYTGNVGNPCIKCSGNRYTPDFGDIFTLKNLENTERLGYFRRLSKATTSELVKIGVILKPTECIRANWIYIKESRPMFYLALMVLTTFALAVLIFCLSVYVFNYLNPLFILESRIDYHLNYLSLIIGCISIYTLNISPTNLSCRFGQFLYQASILNIFIFGSYKLNFASYRLNPIKFRMKSAQASLYLTLGQCLIHNIVNAVIAYNDLDNPGYTEKTRTLNFITEYGKFELEGMKYSVYCLPYSSNNIFAGYQLLIQIFYVSTYMYAGAKILKYRHTFQEVNYIRTTMILCFIFYMAMFLSYFMMTHRLLRTAMISLFYLALLTSRIMLHLVTKTKMVLTQHTSFHALTPLMIKEYSRKFSL